jgi:hypothetical protein
MRSHQSREALDASGEGEKMGRDLRSREQQRLTLTELKSGVFLNKFS